MILSDLSAEQREYLAEEAEFELSRRSYEEYFMMTQNWGRDEDDAKRTVMYPYTKMICNALQPILDGERRFLIVEMPPQHGKSTTITETFPSAFLMKNPDKEVMVTSYADDLAQRFGTRNLEKFDQFAGRMYGLKVSDRKHTANEWQIAGHRGAMHSTTILGAATGKHADLLIVDDPLKDMQQANSPTIRKKILEEWQGSLNSRLSADASIIVIMTRWHVSGLGRLLIGRTGFALARIAVTTCC
ncbi:terminase large subunit domain-containing protein [Levilactobacillus brevis]|uniref:terminase large subunit domain-containing protein n=1 Tax=Levilactobacillus brevis TaxID=1580 RepID=UPI0004BA4E24|nr:terminase family protein [Levilactobacillus brevis]